MFQYFSNAGFVVYNQQIFSIVHRLSISGQIFGILLFKTAGNYFVELVIILAITKFKPENCITHQRIGQNQVRKWTRSTIGKNYKFRFSEKSRDE